MQLNAVRDYFVGHDIVAVIFHAMWYSSYAVFLDRKPKLILCFVDYQEGDTVLGYDISNAVFNDEDLNGFKVLDHLPPLVPHASFVVTFTRVIASRKG